MAMAESDTGDVREKSRKIDKEKRQTALILSDAFCIICCTIVRIIYA